MTRAHSEPVDSVSPVRLLLQVMPESADHHAAAHGEYTCKICWQCVTSQVAAAGDAGVEGSSLWARHCLQHLHILLW